MKIEELKKYILTNFMVGLSPDFINKMRLIVKDTGKELNDGNTLSDHDVTDYQTINVVRRLA